MYTNISELQGLTLKNVTGAVDGEEIVFEAENGRTFVMRHDQD